MPGKPRPKTAAVIEKSLRIAGKKSLSKAIKTGFPDDDKTPSGRVVVLRFGGVGDYPLKTVYLDQVKCAISGAAPAKKRTLYAAAKKRGDSGNRKKSPVKKKIGAISHYETSSTRIPAPIREFTGYFIVNIRRILCPSGRATHDLGTSTSAAVTALALWLSESFALKDVTAKAVAVAILITLVKATQGTFCDMTAEMTKKAVKRA